MRKWILMTMTVLLLLSLSACGDSFPIEGKSYIYENEGFGGGDFVLTFHEDGTCNYYEGAFSSYIAEGKWVMEDSLVTIRDDDYMGYELENHFRYDGENLVFVEENSTNFSYVEVKDGEVFYKQSTAE